MVVVPAKAQALMQASVLTLVLLANAQASTLATALVLALAKAPALVLASVRAWVPLQALALVPAKRQRWCWHRCWRRR